MTTVDDRLQPPAGSVRRISGTSSAWQRRYARLLLIPDTFAIAAAVGLAQWIRFGTSPERSYLASAYAEISLVIALSWMAALSINHSRSERVLGSGAEEYRRVWMGTISVFGAVAIVSMLLKLEIARGYLMIALPTGAFLLFFFRWLARRLVVLARRRHGHCVTRVLVVGNPPAVRDLTTALAREPGAGYEVVGACIPGPGTGGHIEIRGVGSIPTFGNESNIVAAVTETGSQAVAITATEQLDGRRIKDLSWDLEKLDIDLLVAPGVVDVAGPRLHMRPVAGLPLIHVEKPQYHGAKQFQKRLFDLGFSVTVLILGSPLLLAIAVAVKLSSRGPVFYRQERIGLNGDEFKMVKFRTMVDGADKIDVNVANLDLVDSPRDAFKFVNDPRVTPIGRLLRKYSLDELPQFFNAIKGEMSVVGPRPQVKREVQTYDDYVRRRLLVRPGITGLWQVSGRSDLSWDDSVRLDLFYVENWSMMSDFLITLKTVKAVFSHSGAY